MPAGNNQSKTHPANRGASRFSESAAWAPVGEGWRQLHGNFREHGFSVEWHDFTLDHDLDWSGSFHPGCVEICLNLAGEGRVQAGDRTLALASSSSGFYFQKNSTLTGSRRGGERHQFITIEFSLPFLRDHLPGEASGVDPRLSSVFEDTAGGVAGVSEPSRMTGEHRQMALSLRRPPVYAAAQKLWYRSKALEFAAALLYQPVAGEELFCERHKRVSHERVVRVIAILKENLAEPPSLEEIARRVGCSQFYLSRIFTQEMGKTISAHLRDLRMDRGAELLREGRLNVTEVALEVGYSSPSHFSSAFHATFGCCPGLYPLSTQSQRVAKKVLSPES